MDFTELARELRQKGLAACRYEKEGHERFRDCVYVVRNGRIYFERYSYGEAASLVFGMRAKRVQPNGAIEWDAATTSYSGWGQAPQKLERREGEALHFDGKAVKWLPAAWLKTCPQLGFGRFKMFFLRFAKK